MAALLGVKPAQVRILTGNVGGSFGMKGSPYPEYAGMFHASKLLGRPVKWTDERSGSFLSDQHGRDHDFDAELALDKDGTLPRRAAGRLRQSRRLSLERRRRDGRARRHAQSRRDLPHAADRGLDQGLLHQHLADRRLSRRRPARGQLLHGAADRHRRARDGHRPGRDAQAQPHQAGGDALQDRVGHGLRQRRVHRAARQGAEARRRRRASPRARKRARRAASCAGWASATISRSPRRR